MVVCAEFVDPQLVDRLFGLPPSDRDEAIRLGPPHRLGAELGHLDASAGTPVPQEHRLACDRDRQADDDHKAGPQGLEPLDLV